MSIRNNPIHRAYLLIGTIYTLLWGHYILPRITSHWHNWANTLPKGNARWVSYNIAQWYTFASVLFWGVVILSSAMTTAHAIHNYNKRNRTARYFRKMASH